MARITALESDMEKAKRERENALQEERVKASRHGFFALISARFGPFCCSFGHVEWCPTAQKQVRKLELELNLLSDGDTMRLRSQLRAEHDAEVAQVTAAAEASVQTLQELLDQTEAGDGANWARKSSKSYRKRIETGVFSMETYGNGPF